MEDARARRRDAVANRAKIVEAAAAAFAEHGLSVDMRGVAERAGVGVGTLYRHFPTKELLLQEIIGADPSGLAVSELPPGLPAASALREFFGSAVRRLARNPGMLDLLARTAPSDAELARCLAHMTGLGEQAVERSRADRTLAADVTPADVAYQFLALVRVVQLLPGPAAADLERQVDIAVRGLERR
ncbi:helix-turn-helix domain containing protein [Sphaerisporangium sp. TRM90804]|uniref:TetR/AcrR family transcriptional regulator n=1 Tax=Sphaerisporangium sp. TRM90804 TaxID=3031113 RepID=UPI00244BD22D|nr:helix-turn-helix domain containing protein [Sphaerisporangium sp. TRM90804]MDH2428145.1 helix-turn-helix domain containing protein [Sphaerisporangium sp. TRM90804]